MDEQQHLKFFLAGVQKGGTTALDALLRRHTHIQMAAAKELHFFDREDMDWRTPDYSTLHAQFDWSERLVIRGEATPIYIFWPNCIKRIARYNRDAKIIILLRHPSFRAYSHWKMEITRQDEARPFLQAVVADAEGKGAPHRITSYVARGMYARQIGALMHHFPRNQVLFLRTDHLWSSPNSTLAAVCQFLEIPSFEPLERSSYVVPIRTALEALPPVGQSYLDKIYRPEILESERLTGLDLSDWLDHEYAEPMAEQAAEADLSR